MVFLFKSKCLVRALMCPCFFLSSYAKVTPSLSHRFIMCLNRLQIFNKYTGQFLTVDCGHCIDCKMKKASLLQRKIFNDWETGFNYFFVTLTYNNKHVPYVLHQNILHDDSVIRVYRGASELVSTVRFDSKEQYFSVVRELSEVPFLRNHFVFGAVGVLLWSDLVLFLKRLRKNLSKNGYSFKYIACSEYGETFRRPHFHVLFKTKVPGQIFQDSIMSCWPYCDFDSLKRWFEPAISPQKYLSLYLASDICLPSFYKISYFRPKKSHSLGFGLSSREFSLRSVFHAAETHNLTYSVPSVGNTSASSYTVVPLPSYVVRRYFPVFKGISKLLYSDFLFFAKSVSQHEKGHSVLEPFAPVSEKEKLVPLYSACSQGLRYHSILRRLRLSPKDIIDIIHKVNRVYLYAKELNVDFDYYLSVWYSVSIIIFSQNLRNSLLSCSTPKDFTRYYFNINDFMNGKIRAPTLEPIFEQLYSLDDVSSISNFDLYQHSNFHRKFYKYDKNKKIKTYLL